MKIEKVIVQRDAICRWSCNMYNQGGHTIKKGNSAIKIHDLMINGGFISIFVCETHVHDLINAIINATESVPKE